MFKKIIVVLVIALLLFFLLYERISSYLSTLYTRNYYKTHPVLNDSSHIASEHYILKKLSEHEGYSGNIKDFIFYDNEREEFVWEFFQAPKQIVVSKEGNISEIDTASKIERTSKSALTVYPEKYYAFEHQWKSKNQPINIVSYHKESFEWPHACPYIGIPICNGWMWNGNAFFEVEHKGETLKFHLNTQYHLFDGYDGQVYLLSLPENTNSEVAFLNINTSSNAVGRSTGWYVIVPKSASN